MAIPARKAVPGPLGGVPVGDGRGEFRGSAQRAELVADFDSRTVELRA